MILTSYIFMTSKSIELIFSSVSDNRNGQHRHVWNRCWSICYVYHLWWRSCYHSSQVYEWQWQVPCRPYPCTPSESWCPTASAFYSCASKSYCSRAPPQFPSWLPVRSILQPAPTSLACFERRLVPAQHQRPYKPDRASHLHMLQMERRRPRIWPGRLRVQRFACYARIEYLLLPF